MLDQVFPAISGGCRFVGVTVQLTGGKLATDRLKLVVRLGSSMTPCTARARSQRKGASRTSKFDVWKAALFQLEKDRQDYNSLDVKRVTGSLGSAKQWLNSLALFQRLATLRVRGDATLTNSVASSCNVNNGPWITPLKLLHSLQAAGIKPDGFSFGVCVKALNGIVLQRGSAWEEAYELLTLQYSRQSQLSPVVWGTVLDTMGKARRWKMGLDLLMSMWLAPRPKVDAHCVNVIISGGSWRMSLELLSVDAVDEVSFNSAMANLEGDQGPLVWGLFSKMRALSIEPTEVTYGTAANVFGSAWSSALQSIFHGRWASTAPNIVSFGACLNACQKGGNWKSALTLIQSPSFASLQLNAPCSGAALNSCSMGRQWTSALSFLYCLAGSAIGLTMPMLGAAMAACEGAVDDPDFVDVLEGNMPHCDAQETLWQRTLCFYNICSLPDSGKRGTPVRKKLAPDLVTIGIGVSACGKGEQWAKSLQLIEMAKLQQLEPTPTILNSVLNGMDRALCWTQSLALLALFEEERLNLDSLSLRSIMQASEASSNHLQSLGCGLEGKGRRITKIKNALRARCVYIIAVSVFVCCGCLIACNYDLTQSYTFICTDAPDLLLQVSKDARLPHAYRGLDRNRGCPDLLNTRSANYPNT